MSNVILTKEYEAPPVNKKEVLRYAGCKNADAGVASLLDSCIEELSDKLVYKVCYCLLPLHISGENVDLGNFSLSSGKLALCLKGCKKAVVFAATVGIGPDRLVMRYGSTAAARALMLQAVGAERIETLCNSFCDDVAKEYGSVTPRFSPGYGDLSIETQKDIFAFLEPNKRIGLYLNDSMLMAPAKSVTAIFGIVE